MRVSGREWKEGRGRERRKGKEEARENEKKGGTDAQRAKSKLKGGTNPVVQERESPPPLKF